jgi:23S rRNA pseudouridine1911/1915/1917 synthase
VSDPDVLYVDNHLLVVNKPSGTLVQGDRTGDRSLLEESKDYVKVAFDKPGNVFLGLVHRLDRPTSGVIVFARTSKAASRLSDQFRRREIKKTYWALVEGKVPPHGRLEDWLIRDGQTSKVSNGTEGQKAALEFKRLTFDQGISWLEVDLESGRHHQVRVQFSHRGHPVIGDLRYGSRVSFPNKAIALHARSLVLTHPTRKEEMRFEAEPEDFWPHEFR